MIAGAPAELPLIVVLPSFSESRLALLGRNEVFRYRLDFDEAADPILRPAGRLSVADLGTVELDPGDLLRVSAAIGRNARMAVGRLESELDGTTHYLSSGPESCMMTWPPREPSIAERLAAIADELVSTTPSGSRVRDSVAQVERMEASLR